MSTSIFKENILADRVALITGGGTGITYGVAHALAMAGARVTLVSRRAEHLAPAVERLQADGAGDAHYCVADVRDYAAVEKAVAETLARHKRLDIVVNGAAGNFLCAAHELSANGFGTVVDIDLKGTFNVCRASYEALKAARGHILNISATLHYVGTQQQLHVSAAKAGVDALTRNLAVEWGREGIRANAIAPGPIEDTEGMNRLVPLPVKEKLRRSIPLGRFGRREDIAACAVFLCSDAASFINGAIIVVDGGQWLSATVTSQVTSDE